MISVVRFGPIKEHADERLYWVFLGWSEAGRSILVHANTDEEGLAAVSAQADGEPLRCEPKLSAIAKQLGLSVGTPPLDAYRIAAIAALGISATTESDPEGRSVLLESCTRFLAKKPWKQWPTVGGVRMLGFCAFGIDLSGPVDECAELVIARSPEEREGLYTIGLFKDDGSTERFVELARRGEPCLLPGLVLTISDEPSWVADIVARAYGQRFAVYASRTGADGPKGYTLPEAAALAAVLDALAKINRKVCRAVGRVETAYGIVRVELSTPVT